MLPLLVRNLALRHVASSQPKRGLPLLVLDLRLVAFSCFSPNFGNFFRFKRTHRERWVAAEAEALRYDQQHDVFKIRSTVSFLPLVVSHALRSVGSSFVVSCVLGIVGRGSNLFTSRGYGFSLVSGSPSGLLKVSVLTFVHCGQETSFWSFLHRPTSTFGWPLLASPPWRSWFGSGVVVFPPLSPRFPLCLSVGTAELRASAFLVFKVYLFEQAVFWVMLKFRSSFFFFLKPRKGRRLVGLKERLMQ